MFIKPTTRNSFAKAIVCSVISSTMLCESEYGGIVQAESPEWIPASSICSITPATYTSVPSDKASTSTSIAFSKNLSIRIGCSNFVFPT